MVFLNSSLQDVNTARILGMAAGLVVGFLAAAIIIKMAHSNHKFHSKYDEKQKADRGIAFRNGFYTFFIGSLIAYCIRLIVPGLIPESHLLILLVVLGVSVTIVTMILKDCYLGLNEKPVPFIIIFAAVTVFLIIEFIYFSRGCEEDYNRDSTVFMAGMAIIMAVLTITTIARQLFLRRENRKGDD